MRAPDREKEIQELCKQIANMHPSFHYHLDRADESVCPICYKRVYNSRGTMATISHEPNCGYLIAKDLTTNL